MESVGTISVPASSVVVLGNCRVSRQDPGADASRSQHRQGKSLKFSSHTGERLGENQINLKIFGRHRFSILHLIFYSGPYVADGRNLRMYPISDGISTYRWVLVPRYLPTVL